MGLVGGFPGSVWWRESLWRMVFFLSKKDIIRALVERYVSDLNRKPFDVIRGKGRNLIILLQYDFG
jgi:hypothetical protein